ncbi:MAG: DNA primase [Cereibacter sphaeroides]|uniref:DNA primase n=1 Tax=Cereibacter sphaeroides TaxID=1063 RepID=A0A2W5SIM5_CERSP|nr:MAG: DNA primase [Cereibacter sphaeroides]
MSLPPGFLDELRTRVSLSQVVGRKVTWDLRKSNQNKGDMWAPCPFHQERSASFHVDDRKGFYYCFGCHAKGDAVSFLKETENLSFMEAVEWLAREAGMPMPARDPRAAEKADRRSQLVEVMEEAVKWFRLQLKTSAAGPAREYLTRRRLTPEAQDRFEIGFAPDARQGIFQALTQKGISPDLIVDAGLCARPEDGGTPYDRFRGRIIFPIRDARGRAISLGGRAMDPNARAKYLNGPETEIFDKGRNLYNIAPARAAAAKGAGLVVAEGYMDTIALSEAGFGATVAPLGTAITEDQLRLMWRIHSEPVIALDGDKAGFNAALRLIDLALPLLEAGQGLRFALLPEGLDPDDLIKAQGAPAMQKVIDSAQPMVSLLWARETEGRNFDSPERKAALDKTLRAALMRIKDASIRGHYGEEIKRLRWELFGTRPTKRAFVPGTPRGRDLPQPPRAVTLGSVLANPMAGEEKVLEAVLLATLVTHPALVIRYESQIEMLHLAEGPHEDLRHLLLRHAHADAAAEKIAADARELLETLFAQSHVQSAPPVRNRNDAELALMCVAEGLAKLDALRGARAEIEEAMEDMSGLVDEGLTWRLDQAAKARNAAQKTNLEDAADMGEDRAAMSRHLQNLIDGQVWVKKKG